MLSSQPALINEQTSPLFRLMWMYNSDEPHRRHFDNNICAFHIGNGYILSVAHNLRSEAGFFKSMHDDMYKREILPHLDKAEAKLYDQYFFFDPATKKRYINIPDPAELVKVTEKLKQINFDSRWITLTQRKFCTPHLIVQFKEDLFYNDASLTKLFKPDMKFHETGINRHTFIMETALVEAFYSEDIALYKIVNTDPALIAKLPFIEPDFSVLNDDQANYYCLQSSPGSELGKLLNKAQIEGFLEQFSIFPDRIGGNYAFEGLRYLIKGYFRFGSSGAPYVFFDTKTGRYKVNAIQSEASPIQLAINNKRDGNFQYVNAIASPLKIIEDRLKAYLVG